LTSIEAKTFEFLQSSHSKSNKTEVPQEANLTYISGGKSVVLDLRSVWDETEKTRREEP